MVTPSFIWQRNVGPLEDIQESETLKIGFPLQYDGRPWPELQLKGWVGVYQAEQTTSIYRGEKADLCCRPISCQEWSQC